VRASWIVRFDDVPFIERIAPEIKLLKSLVINKHKNASGLPALTAFALLPMQSNL
jgi:hypothetical protein